MNQNPTDTFIQIENAAHDGAFGLNNLKTPTDAQCIAGNYKVGKTTIYGMPVAIEQPRHSYRTGIDTKTGKRWATRLAAHYGYFMGTKGADGDAVDCFIGFYPQSEHAWVINQHVNGAFDEHKVVIAVPDEEAARKTYLDSYEKGWSGLHSIVKTSISQLKWWLKNGNLKNPLKPEHLPYEGLETMNQRITWDSTQTPEQMPLHSVLYEIRRADAGENLVLDAVTMADILAEADEIMALDALISPYTKLQRKMEVLQTVMERAGGEVKPVAMQLSEPFKQGGVAQVAAVFELSDGQTVSIFFHNPDVNPKKIAPADELISWKWLLNKKDITIVVAPERGEDLNVKAVAQRIIKLAEKNSAAFKRANVKRAENLAAIESLKAEIPVLEKELADAQKELELVKLDAENKAAAGVEAQKKADEDFAQSVYQSLIDDYGWQNDAKFGIWANKTIGGGRVGGVLNPNGDRRVSAKVQGEKLVAMWGDNPLVSVDIDREADAKANAGKLDAAVNAEDPRYVAPVVDELDPTSPEGYAKIKGIANMELRYQDVLDSFFQERIATVWSTLKELGWEGMDRGRYDVSKNGYIAHFNFKNVGAGANVVGYWVEIKDGDDFQAEISDNLTGTPEDVAAQIDAVVTNSGTVTKDNYPPATEIPQSEDQFTEESRIDEAATQGYEDGKAGIDVQPGWVSESDNEEIKAAWNIGNKKGMEEAVSTTEATDISNDPAPATDQNQPHIDTLQAVVDGQHDADTDVMGLFDKVIAAGEALVAAGLGEQYDELIGKAADKVAELDAKANG